MKNITDKNLGAKLRKLREAVAMEQDMVACALHIPRTAVVDIEKGSRSVSAMELVDLCKIFRTTPNDILDWNSYQTRKYGRPTETNIKNGI